MERKNYDAIDIAKLVSALLVVCIHTFPFADISMNANFVVVSILARLAVPFFFISSAYFFFRKIDFHKSYRDSENKAVLIKYLKRLGKIYLIWSLLYLPYNFILIHQGGFSIVSVIRYLRDVLFTGSYYHLWFLPSLMFSITVSYYTILKFGVKKTMVFSSVCYIIGMMGNLYPNLIEQIPVIGHLFELYETVFVTTRNGLFFGMIFVTLGAYAIRYPNKAEQNQISLYAGMSFVLLVIECLFLKLNGFIYDLSSMYLMLIPCVYFIFIRLLQVNMKPKPMYHTFRILSLLIYVSHILFAQAFLWMMPTMNSFLFYVLTVGCSFLFSYLIYHGSKHYAILKQLY